MDDRRRWTLAATGASGAALALLLLLRRSRRQPSADDDDPPPSSAVDFASFLVTPVATHPSEPSAPSSSSRWDRKRTKAAETSFDSFLKARAEPDPADFASFLRNGVGVGVGGANGAPPSSSSSPSAAPQKAEETIPPDRAPVLVLYGTEYGFAREIAEKLAAAMKATGKKEEAAPAPAPAPASADGALPWPCVVDMADATPSLLGAQQAALLVCSTQGDGVPPTEARAFCEWVFAGCKGGDHGDDDAAAAAASGDNGADALPPKPKPPTLAPPRHSVLALGDTTYTHFCRAGKMLDAALAAAGSVALAPRVDVDKEDWKAVDGWIAAVLAELPRLGLRPLSALGGAAAAVALGGAGGGGGGAAAAGGASAAAAPPLKKPLAWGKSRPFPARVTAVEPLCRGLSGDWREDKAAARVEVDVSGAGPRFEGYLPGDALGIWPVNAPSGVQALLAQLASLAAAAVDADALGACAVPTPSWHYSELEPAAPAGPGGDDGAPPPLRPPVAAPKAAELPLREALARCYDLRAPKGEPLLRALRDALASGGGEEAAGADDDDAGGADEARRLGAVLAGGKAAVDAYLEPRHVIDVLREHPAAAAALMRAAAPSPGGEKAAAAGPPEAAAAAAAALAIRRALLPHLRQLQPRLYSISSSPLEAPGRVQATIAVVRYESLGEERVGVCSTYAAERAVAAAAAAAQGADGDGGAAAAAAVAAVTMRVFVHPNPDFRLPPDPSTPIIMVGPGTGLAPFRAFILQRLLEREQKKQQNGNGSHAAAPPDSGAEADADNMVLFFGSRRRDQDYLYGDQLEAWARQGVLSLHTAFSREPGRPKVYVQQRLREQGARVWRLLADRGAHFYVCGDASSMAPAVEEALLGVMREVGGLGEEEAAARLAAMAAEGRYQRDVWFG